MAKLFWMEIETMSSESFHNKNPSNKIFWIFMVFLICFSAWAYYFKLEKSVNVTGQIKPMGFPIIVQGVLRQK